MGNLRPTLVGFGDVKIEKVFLTNRFFVAKNRDTGRAGYRAYPLGAGHRSKHTVEVILVARQPLLRFTLWDNLRGCEEFTLVMNLSKPNSMKSLADKLKNVRTPPWTPWQYFASFIYGLYWEYQAGFEK